jgi:hypothetical protein
MCGIPALAAIEVGVCHPYPHNTTQGEAAGYGIPSFSFQDHEACYYYLSQTKVMAKHMYFDLVLRMSGRYESGWETTNMESGFPFLIGSNTIRHIRNRQASAPNTK